ncbi:clasp N terminal-domain-containing protein [Chytriomyces cf. hyalinus JEL632]|nr:clasp N terminal-domain-containing protein [Chytriomyces cf. hyalinus JEL632]
MAPASQVVELDMGGVESEVDKVASVFAVKESEETWMPMDDALTRLAAVTRGSADHPGFVACVRRLKQPLLDALNTDRTRLARTALLLCEVLSVSLQERFDGLADFLLPALLRLSTRANKVIVTCATSALKTIIDNSGVASILPMLAEHICLPSPSKSLRICAAECLNRVLESTSASAKIDKYAEAIENAIKSGTVDSTPEVRALIRTAFESYRHVFPSRLDRFVASLPDVAAKYLKISKSGTAPNPSILNRKAPPRPRAPTASSTASSNIVRPPQPVSRASTVTPDSYSRSMNLADEDETRSLESETPSFTFEGEDARQFQQSLKQQSVRDASKQQSARLPENAAAASALAGARRLLVAQSSRDAGPVQPQSNHLAEHLGGAQRILKEGKPAIAVAEKGVTAVHTLSKAQRVPAVVAAPSAESTHRVASEEHASAPLRSAASSTSAGASAAPPTASSLTANQKDTKVAKKAALPVAAKATTKSRKQETIDFTDTSTKLKCNDWSVRFKVLEAISAHMSEASAAAVPASLASDMRLKASKYCSILLLGLNDNNHKCATVSMQGLVALFDGSFAALEMVEVVVPRIAALVYYQPSKTKAPLVELGQRLIVNLADRFGIDMCAIACIHALNHPEFVKVVKVRGGCMAMLAELSEAEWRVVLVKPTNMKLYMTRILSQISDADTTIQKSLKVCLSALHSSSSDAFWSGWAAVKPAEKKAVNTLFHSADISYSGKELEAAKKLTQGISASSIASMSRESSSSQLLPPFKMGTPSRSDPFSAPVKSDSLPNFSENEFEDESHATGMESAACGASPRDLDMHANNKFGRNTTQGIMGPVRDELSINTELQNEAEHDDMMHERTVKTPTNQPIVQSPLLTPTIARSVSSYGTSSDRIGVSATASKAQAKSAVPHVTNTVPRFAPLSSKLPTPSPIAGRIPVWSRPQSRQSTSASPNMSRTISYPGDGRAPTESLNHDTPVKRLNNRHGILTSPTLFEDSEMSYTTPALPPRPASVSGSVIPASYSAAWKAGDHKDHVDRNPCFKSEPLENIETRFQAALQSSMQDLALFVLDRSNAVLVRRELESIVGAVFDEARIQEGNADIGAIKSAILVLKYIIQSFDLKARCTDLVLALLWFENKPLASTEDQLELEFELDSMLAVLKKVYAPKVLLQTAADCLEHPSLAQLSLKPSMCFDLAAYAIESGEHDEADIICWNRVIGFIACGLGSTNMPVRKSAFNCAVALGKRRESLVDTLYGEVGAMNGRGREGVIRGMLERRLGR